jgi:import receptor subunit TOM22
MPALALPSLPASAKNAAANLSYGAWRLARSTGRASWIAVTSFLVLAVPLIIELDR